MNLKYKILWFEDDEEVVNEQIGPKLIDFLFAQGFKLEIKYQPNGEKLEELLVDKNIDLIVTDLNLGEYEAGDKLIDHIRSGNILTEVLLYSANATPLNEIVNKKGWIERASFCIGLGILESRVKEIITLTIRKHQDVNNTRGLVIAETILLEKKIENILLHYFNAAEDKVQSVTKDKLLKKIHRKKIEQHEADIDKIEKIDFKKIKELIDNDILTASNSYNAIQSILKEKVAELNIAIHSIKGESNLRKDLEAKKDDLSTMREELNKFQSEIIKIRNTLAHVSEKTDKEGYIYLETFNEDGSSIIFTNSTYIEIRKNLGKHSDNLDKIFSNIL